MLHRNDIFKFNGQLRRLLHVESAAMRAWSIAMNEDGAWPKADAWGDIRDLDVHTPTDSGDAVPYRDSTPAMERAKDAALHRIADLVKRIPAIFDNLQRGPMVAARAQELGCSRTTIFKDLRRYWRGGQTPSALLGDFHRCGVTQAKATAGRGRATVAGHPVYQLTDEDSKHFRTAIERHYLLDVRLKIPHSYQRMLEQHYQTADGNGDLWIRPAGERPSLRQFEHFLRTNYSLERRYRSRLGAKDFERDHRAKLSTVLADCLGVGHYYEADATILDVYLVAAENVQQIVGKPTLYLIFDRKSRLIVGWYLGLENPSWACAKQAMVSISEDKAAMCARYGVRYEPEDWPAHMVFPKEFLADRGEMLVRASTQLSDDLEGIVTNVPGKRGDWKPVVECGFKQIRVVLEDGTPGFDPPENAMKRQGKHYEKDACLTLKQIGEVVLGHIISHNRTQMQQYELSIKELCDQVEPSPIALWNHNIRERSGLLPRFTEERVRLALLPRAEATVSEEGIFFSGCFYTCPEALAGGWFVQARKKRFKVQVSYDGRLVDTIYVFNHDRRGQLAVCTLTPRSEKFRGLSFPEVIAFEKMRNLLNPSIEQSRLQARADLHAATEPTIAKGKKRLAEAGRGITRTARKADIKDARNAELRIERREIAGPPSATPRDGQSIAVAANVVQLRAHRRSPPASPQPVDTASDAALRNEATSVESAASQPQTMAQKLALMRERMRNG